jgi:Xaa-Pro dipeptidase
MLPFTRDEYTHRLTRVREAMNRDGLDVLLVFHQEHMYYLTGYDQIGYWVYQVLIVPAASSELTAIVRRVDEMLVRQSPFISDVRVWLDDSPIDPVELTLDVLKERQLLHGKRIGIEKKSHALLPYYYDRLRLRLSGGELVDSSELITEIRLIKSPAEIAYMRRAGEIMDRAVRAGFDSLRPGAREYEIHASVAHAMYSAGGGPPAVAPPIASGPNVLSQTHSAAGDRAVEEGEPLMIEVGAQYRRYHAVCLRTASLGQPAPKLRAMHDAIIEATDIGLQTIAAGVPTAEVARRVLAALEVRGFSKRGSHVGYGIGLGYPPTWVDNLRIKETDTRFLQPGMTFMLYGVLVDPQARTAAACGDPVLVTEAGSERLTALSRELVIK